MELEPKAGGIGAIDHEALPPALQAAVAASLSRRERVLWLGRPGRSVWVGLPHRLRGLVWLGLAVAAAVFARDVLDDVNVDWPLPGEGLIVAGAVLLALPGLLLAAVAAGALATPGRLRGVLSRTAYVVTDARAMVVVGAGSGPPQVRRYRRRSLRRAELRPRPAGRGDVRLEHDAGPPTDGFFNVERAATVHRLLLRVGDKNAPPRP